MAGPDRAEALREALSAARDGLRQRRVRGCAQEWFRDGNGSPGFGQMSAVPERPNAPTPDAVMNGWLQAHRKVDSVLRDGSSRLGKAAATSPRPWQQLADDQGAMQVPVKPDTARKLRAGVERLDAIHKHLAHGRGHEHAPADHDMAGPEQQNHGRRHLVGVGSRASLISFLRAAAERGHDGIPSRDELLAMDDHELWNTAAEHMNTTLAGVRDTLDSLPERKGGENAKATEIPAQTLRERFGNKIRSARASLSRTPAPEQGPRLPEPGHESPSTPGEPTAAENDARLAKFGYKAEGKPKPTRAGRKILGGFEDTQKKHQDEHGQYTPEREQLHNDIIMRMLEGKSPSENPRAIFMAGGSGSGKTSAEEMLDPDTRASIAFAVKIDPDKIKEMLPEYDQLIQAGDPIAAAATHEESSDIAKMLKETAEQMGYDIYLDGTGDSEVGKFLKKIEASQRSGHHTTVILVDIPTEVAMSRAISRAYGNADIGGDKATGSGRMVPPDVIRSIHANATANYLQWRDSPAVDSFLVYDNNVPEGKPPILAVEGGRGQWQEVDPHLAARIEAKGRPAWEASDAFKAEQACRTGLHKRGVLMKMSCSSWGDNIAGADPEVMGRVLDLIPQRLTEDTLYGGRAYDIMSGLYKKVYNPSGEPKPSSQSPDEFYDSVVNMLKGGRELGVGGYNDGYWAHRFGKQQPNTDDPGSLQRFYLNLKPDHAVDVNNQLTAALEQAGVPWQSKMPAELKSFNRSDAAVLYVNKDDYDTVSAALRQIYESNLDAFDPEVPEFTKRISPGVATAAEPDADHFMQAFGQRVSFGSANALILTEAIQQLAEMPEGTDWNPVVRAAYERHGIDPDRPWLMGFDAPGAAAGAEHAAAAAPTEGAPVSFGEGNVDTYHKGLEEIDRKYPGFVTVYPPEHYHGDNVRVFTTPDGKAGYNLTDHGDGRVEVAGVFNHGGPAGAGTAGLEQGVEQGGNYLEAYDGFLPYHYFKAVGAMPRERWPWDEQYRHPRWNEQQFGTPGVVPMDIPRPEELANETLDQRIGRLRQFIERYKQIGGGEGVPGSPLSEMLGDLQILESQRK